MNRSSRIRKAAAQLALVSAEIKQLELAQPAESRTRVRLNVTRAFLEEAIESADYVRERLEDLERERVL